MAASNHNQTQTQTRAGSGAPPDQPVENRVSITEIAKTEDTAESVFRATYGDAEMVFVFPRNEPQDVWVQTVISPERGGMKAMLDHVCREYECETVRFVNVIGPELEQRVSGGTIVEETVPEPHPCAGDTVRCLDVTWQVGPIQTGAGTDASVGAGR